MDRPDAPTPKDYDTESASADAGRQARPRQVRSIWAVLHPLELLLVVGFLALVFVLGLFPLKDTDFWWHLRTGDWILANRSVPNNDIYTYTVPEARWVDMHWGFQVLLSIGYRLGGVPLLTLAKSAITTAAMGVLLLGCRRPGWPLWVGVLGWLPALGVMSGRMYVRPETLSLWWISLVLLVIFHWRKHPRIMWLLPPVFFFWVNMHGLFVLGFVIIALGLVEVLADPTSWQRDQRPWWGRAIACIGLSVIVAIFNPYGIRGLFFPLALAGTMGNPVFRSIGELTPIPQFIQSLGFKQFPVQLSLGTLPTAISVIVANFASFPLPLKLHLGTIALCLVSFLVPVVLGLASYFRQLVLFRLAVEDAAEAAKRRGGGESSRSSRRKRRTEQVADGPAERPALKGSVRFSLFRLLMFVFFTVLSFQATRNSHQFAAVLGTVTAANFAQWAALRAEARKQPGQQLAKGQARRLSPGNAVALALVGLCLVWVGSGRFYVDAGEGRTIGWGEEPLWFPHEAVKAAGADGLPAKFASFHNGHAALYDYYWGPEKKVFSDARLEVIGPNLYQDQMRLSAALNQTDPNWRALVAKAGRPVILADHLTNSGVSVTLLAANDYTCIHFDPIAAVFTPAESLGGSSQKGFNFLSAHYSADGFRAYNQPERLALAKAMRNISGGLAAQQRDDLARQAALAGLGLAARFVEETPTEFEAWKLLGQLLNVALVTDTKRTRTPESFDPVADLATVRSIYALKRAAELNRGDFSSIYSLALLQRGLLQNEQELETLGLLVQLTPINTTQAAEIENARGRMAALRQLMGLGANTGGTQKNQPALSTTLSDTLAKPLAKASASRAEIERSISDFLRNGLVGRAAESLNAALPVDDPPQELLEKLGALWLWLGQPEEARLAFGKIKAEPRRQLLLACGWLAAGQKAEAMKLLEEATGKLTGDAGQADLAFATALVRCTNLLEQGDEPAGRKELAKLKTLAKTPAQRDLLERLGRQVP